MHSLHLLDINYKHKFCSFARKHRAALNACKNTDSCSGPNFHFFPNNWVITHFI